MLPAPRAFGAFNVLLFGPVVLGAGTSGSFCLGSACANRKSLSALHFNQCLLCKAGSFLLLELRVISPSCVVQRSPEVYGTAPARPQPSWVGVRMAGRKSSVCLTRGS